MSEFDDFIRGIGSDIKSAAEQVSKKTGEAFEISKRKAERIRIKGKIQSAYQRLGETVYGSTKNGDDVSEEVEIISAELDFYFERIREIYDEINMIKSGCYVPDEDDDMDWEEEYAEEDDLYLIEDGEDAEESEEEVEVEIIVSEEVPVEVEIVEEPAKKDEFDINID